jgi:NADH:ubiquinone oxidoreductase subunit 2 (subunit N)
MRPVLLYTLARFAIFLATAGVLALVGARGVLLLLLSLLISGVVSFVLLSRQRDRMSSIVETGVRRQRTRFRDARTKEDA